MAINTVHSTKITDTGSEPITTAQAKLHCAIDYSDYDTLIPIYISAARIAIERATGLALVQKTVKITAELQANYPFQLSHSPITEFKYVVPVDIEDYNIELSWDGLNGVNFGANFDVINVKNSGIYDIEYEAGFATVPSDLKLAVLQMFAFIFNHRGEYNEGKLDISVEAERIMQSNSRFLI